MKNVRSLPLMLLGGAVLIFSLTQHTLAQSLTGNQLRAPAKGMPELKAILDAMRYESKEEDRVETIRKQYAKINESVARYKKVKKELRGFSLEGGKLIAYFDGPKIVKIVATHYGEGGKALEEYYYQDDQLIFIYRKDSNYDKPGSGKVVSTSENRFYFSNNQLIRWVDENAKQVVSGSKEYLEKEKEYLQISGEFTTGARSPKSTIEDKQ